MSDEVFIVASHSNENYFHKEEEETAWFKAKFSGLADKPNPEKAIEHTWWLRSWSGAHSEEDGSPSLGKK